MTDLTEQWKKGEFVICNAGKCKYYYVQNEKQQEVIKTEYCLFDDNTPNWQILAPVPSYEECQELIESEAKSHLQADSYYNKILELKELLKEVLRHELSLKEVSELTRKISEALEQTDD